MKFDEKDYLCFNLLKMMKGKELEDGGVIEGFTVTFKDKETGEVKVVKI